MIESQYATAKDETLDSAQIKRCETGDLFGAEYGQLPNGQFRLVSRARLVRFEDHPEGLYGFSRAEYDLSAESWFFANHFHGDPVMPGTLQVEAVLQLAGLYLAWAEIKGVGRAREVGRTVFLDEIRPDTGSKFVMELTVAKIQGRGKLSFLTGRAKGFREDGTQVVSIEGIKLLKALR